MSWVGWLILLAGLYVLVVVLRGIVEFISWFAEEFLGPSEPRRPGEQSTQRSQQAKPRATLDRRKTKGGHGGDKQPTAALAVGGVGVSRVRRPSPLARQLKLLKMAVARKGYDYWVASALSEEDPNIKIAYLSKALKLNPGYLPAWGLKANALFGLQRYAEALPCFDRSLEMHPSTLAWYEKGLCCHRLGRREEAVGCFHKAMEMCQDQDRQLLEDAARMKKLAEDELQPNRAAPEGVDPSTF